MKSPLSQATPLLKATLIFLKGTGIGVSKKMYLVFYVFLVAFFPLGCEKSSSSFDEPLIPSSGTSGENITGYQKSTPIRIIKLVNHDLEEIGIVSTSFNDEGDELTVAYEITLAGLCLTQTNLDAQTDPSNFPMSPAGNPKVSQFGYGAQLDCAVEWTQVIDLTTIEGWIDHATVYVAAKAILNDGVTAWGNGESFPGHTWSMYFSCKSSCPPIITYEGETYPTTVIGNQCWMAKNLNVGEMINSVPNGSQTNNGIIEKYCYDNDPANCEVYGGMYEWWEMMAYAANDEGGQGICPEGWHVPTQEEFLELENFLGLEEIAGGKLKEEGFAHWNYPNAGATNSTGFTALPGGYRHKECGETYDMGINAHFWSSTPWSASPPGDPDGGWRMDLQYSTAVFGRGDGDKRYGFSVRCLKDND